MSALFPDRLLRGPGGSSYFLIDFYRSVAKSESEITLLYAFGKIYERAFGNRTRGTGRAHHTIERALPLGSSSSTRSIRSFVVPSVKNTSITTTTRQRTVGCLRRVCLCQNRGRRSPPGQKLTPPRLTPTMPPRKVELSHIQLVALPPKESARLPQVSPGTKVTCPVVVTEKGDTTEIAAPKGYFYEEGAVSWVRLRLIVRCRNKSSFFFAVSMYIK